jgi:hypothetical protein
VSKRKEPAKKLTIGERFGNRLRNGLNTRKKRLEEQREADSKSREWVKQNKQKSNDPAKTENKEMQEENLDQSVYEPDNPEATQEDDMEEDLALLDEDDDLW